MSLAARLLMFAVAAGFATVFTLAMRRGMMPFWAFPITRNDKPELFYLWGAIIALAAVAFAGAALFTNCCP
jgi:hypothetical protein